MSPQDILVWGTATALSAAFPNIPITKTCPGVSSPATAQRPEWLLLVKADLKDKFQKIRNANKTLKPKARCDTGTFPWLGRDCTTEQQLLPVCGATAAAGFVAWGLYNDPVICHFIIESQHHKVVWVGRHLQDHPDPTPLPWAGTPSTGPGCSKPHPTLPGRRYPQLLQATCASPPSQWRISYS